MIIEVHNPRLKYNFKGLKIFGLIITTKKLIKNGEAELCIDDIKVRKK